MPEIFDRENQPPEKDNGPRENYSESFKKFIKPGIGELDPAAVTKDEQGIRDARATIQVGGDYKPLTSTEKILAEQHHQETVEKNSARSNRPEKSRHLGAKVLAGLAAFAGVLGLAHKASERQEEADKIKDAENAARQRQIDKNKMSQGINYNEKGQVDSVEMPDGTEYKVKE